MFCWGLLIRFESSNVLLRTRRVPFLVELLRSFTEKDFWTMLLSEEAGPAIVEKGASEDSAVAPLGMIGVMRRDGYGERSLSVRHRLGQEGGWGWSEVLEEGDNGEILS